MADKLVFRCCASADPQTPLFLKAYLPWEKTKYRRERSMNKIVPEELWPHVVTMIDYGRVDRPLAGADSFYFIVFPDLNEGSLLDLLTLAPGLSYRARWYLCCSIARNIFYFLRCGLAHLDLKIDNVMLYLDRMRHFCTVLIDLDASASLSELVARWCGTLDYTAPEVAPFWNSTGAAFDPEKVDVFQFGTLLYCILFNLSPFGQISNPIDIKTDERY